MGKRLLTHLLLPAAALWGLAILAPAGELPEEPTASDERLLCQCFKRLLPALPESYRDLLKQIDLEGREVSEVAARLGVTRNNLTVRLHRARRHLRELLAQNCRACSKHGCLDCTCGEPGPAVHCHPSAPAKKQAR